MMNKEEFNRLARTIIDGMNETIEKKVQEACREIPFRCHEYLMSALNSQVDSVIRKVVKERLEVTVRIKPEVSN